MITLLINLISVTAALQTTLFSDTAQCDRAVYVNSDQTLLVSCGSISNGFDQIIKKLNSSTGAMVYNKVITFSQQGYISDLSYDEGTATAHLIYVNNAGNQFWSVVHPIGSTVTIQSMGSKLAADTPPQQYWSSKLQLLYVVGAANSLSQTYANGTQYFITLPNKSGFVAAYNGSFQSVWVYNLGTNNQGYAVTQYSNMILVMVYNSNSGNSWLQPFSLNGVPVTGLTKNLAVNLYLPTMYITGGVLYAGGSGTYQSSNRPYITSFNLTTYSIMSLQVFVTSGPATGDIQAIFVSDVLALAYIVTFKSPLLYQLSSVDLQSSGSSTAAQSLNTSTQYQVQRFAVDHNGQQIWYIGWDKSLNQGGVIKDQIRQQFLSASVTSTVVASRSNSSSTLVSSKYSITMSSTLSNSSYGLSKSTNIPISSQGQTSGISLQDLQFTLSGQNYGAVTTLPQEPETTLLDLIQASLVPLVIAAGGLVLLIVVIVGICCWRRFQKRKKYVSTVILDQDTGTTQFNASLVTAVVTATELSIPAFLEYQFGLDVYQTSLIAKGASGSINNCRIMNKSKFKQVNADDQLVIKNLKTDVVSMTETNRNSFHQEVSMIYMLREQPYFVKMYGYSTKPATILLKYYPHGSLRQYLGDNNGLRSSYPLNKTQVFILVTELSRGIKYLHSKEFVHCDLKPDNVLLDEVRMGLLYPIITDFGISRQVDRSKLKVQDFQLSKLIGLSISYAAPEVFWRFSGKPFHNEDPSVFKGADTYALAMIFMEVISGCKPWSYQM